MSATLHDGTSQGNEDKEEGGDLINPDVYCMSVNIMGIDVIINLDIHVASVGGNSTGHHVISPPSFDALHEFDI